MGIDAFVVWDGKENEVPSYVPFAIDCGSRGYLREAYHGSPYAIPVLLKECYESEDGTARIPASVLRSRLPEVIKIVIEREASIYGNQVDENAPVVRSFVEFVELAEKKEREGITPVFIVSY